jgi:hypothetical protein
LFGDASTGKHTGYLEERLRRVVVMMNGIVVYDVVIAENRRLLHDAERRNRLKFAESMRDRSQSAVGRRFQGLLASIRGQQNDCADQTAFREQLAGC